MYLHYKKYKKIYKHFQIRAMGFFIAFKKGRFVAPPYTSVQYDAVGA